MKKIFTLLFMLTLCLKGFGQDSDTTIHFNQQLVKLLIRQQFANLINPQSNNIIGNFASIDLKEAEINFAGNLVFNNGSILGIKANGGITDGVLPIFSYTKFNSKFGVNVQYNFLFHNSESIQYFRPELYKYKKKVDEINQEYVIKKIEMEQEYAKNELLIEIIKIESEIKNNKKLIDTIEKRIDTINTLLGNADSLELNKDSLNFKKDSLSLQYKKQLIDLDKRNSEIEFKKNQISEIPSQIRQKVELTVWKRTEEEKAKADIKISGFKLGWFSFGYGFSNNSFRLFDPLLAFENQVTKGSFLSHSANINYNFYRFTPAAFESFFLSIGAKYLFDNNLSSLTKVEINETESYGPYNERKVIDKYNAFKGTYKDSLHSFSINADFYYFLFKDNKAAIHLYPEQRIAKGIEPITNLGIGFLLTFKKQTENTNIVNAEIYANLFDLNNNRQSEESFGKRSSYGLRFTFPIAFNSNIKTN